jgi:hypothetical protein
VAGVGTAATKALRPAQRKSVRRMMALAMFVYVNQEFKEKVE